MYRLFSRQQNLNLETFRKIGLGFKLDGDLVGDWLPVSARIVKDKVISLNGNRMLRKKYEILEVSFSTASRLNKLETPD